MPPAKVIFADKKRILRSINEATAAQIAAIDAYHLKDGKTQYTRDFWQAERAEAEWVPRDLNRFAGRELTASERKTWQKAVRDLESVGMIQVYTVTVRLTEQGKAAVDG